MSSIQRNCTAHPVHHSSTIKSGISPCSEVLWLLNSEANIFLQACRRLCIGADTGSHHSCPCALPSHFEAKRLLATSNFLSVFLACVITANNEDNLGKGVAWNILIPLLYKLHRAHFSLLLMITPTRTMSGLRFLCLGTIYAGSIPVNFRTRQESEVNSQRASLGLR